MTVDLIGFPYFGRLVLLNLDLGFWAGAFPLWVPPPSLVLVGVCHRYLPSFGLSLVVCLVYFPLAQNWSWTIFLVVFSDLRVCFSALL